MKRHLIFCIALVAVMASCVKQPQIYRRLTDEEAAIVPYQMGQTIRMLNQDNDTLCFTVVHDTTYVAYNYDDSRYHPYGKMSIEPRPYFYAREVVLQSPPEDSCLLRCFVAPEKVVTVTYEELRLYQDRDFYYWHTLLGRTLPLNDLATTTVTIGETTYRDVHPACVHIRAGGRSRRNGSCRSGPGAAAGSAAGDSRSLRRCAAAP